MKTMMTQVFTLNYSYTVWHIDFSFIGSEISLEEHHLDDTELESDLEENIFTHLDDAKPSESSHPHDTRMTNTFLSVKLYYNFHFTAQQDQLDNNLPIQHMSYQSKVARLNTECSDPEMQKNCVNGQKWRCINEDGRWRKHKCKFHVSFF